MNTPSQHTAHNIKRLRNNRGISTTRLSAALNKLGRQIPATGITRIEKGQRRVDTGDLFALAAVLDVSPLTLLLPWPEDPDTEVEITGVGSMTARQAWAWALGRRPPTLDSADPAADLQRFHLDSLPPWARH
jgi:hypothetical protein